MHRECVLLYDVNYTAKQNHRHSINTHLQTYTFISLCLASVFYSHFSFATFFLIVAAAAVVVVVVDFMLFCACRPAGTLK